MRGLRRETGVSQSLDDMDIDDDQQRMESEEELDVEQKSEINELKSILDQYNYASTVPMKKLPTNLFDLKSLLQVSFLVIYYMKFVKFLFKFSHYY